MRVFRKLIAFIFALAGVVTIGYWLYVAVTDYKPIVLGLIFGGLFLLLISGLAYPSDPQDEAEAPPNAQR